MRVVSVQDRVLTRVMRNVRMFDEVSGPFSVKITSRYALPRDVEHFNDNVWGRSRLKSCPTQV